MAAVRAAIALAERSPSEEFSILPGAMMGFFSMPYRFWR
jgi:hypothetical protein